MDYSLAISLGHNSSAVLIDQDGNITGGYETERFNEIKSSSAFPTEPMFRLLDDNNLKPDDVDVYIGHWFTSGELPSVTTKHCNWEILQKFNGVYSLSSDFTHHDSHLESALVFAGEEFGDCKIFVMDGFGTMGESISIYTNTPFGYKLELRVFGYRNSLGLLYQYATDFMGMKMNNHEYKILAYEVHIDEIGVNKDSLDIDAQTYAREILQRIFEKKFEKDFDPLVNVSALLEVQTQIKKFLQDALTAANVDLNNLQHRRIATAYIVQQIVERVVLQLRKLFPSDNLLLVGGLFYNVKLNSMLCDTAKKFCVMPIAGDQGAALGVYQYHLGNLKWPGHAFWGVRNLQDMQSNNGLIVVDYEDDALHHIESEIGRIGFVNLVRGAMEFGPRALCHTSTLALPTLDVTSIVNQVNNRTAEMPMAPVVTQKQAREIFKDVDKVHKSLEYMILTREYRSNLRAHEMLGAAHFYPDTAVYTGRPQITNDPLMKTLLNNHGPLVNTSLNYHGVPIVFEEGSIVNTHNAQRANRPDLDIKTIVIRN